jgi:prepilin signal peptidase PulO-like enzyme (type II secretory pathway)
VLFSVLILGGLYLVLYLISKGKWVGDGDWLLATAIAIVLAHPWLALNALFVSNLVACAVALPQLKLKTAHQIHLGPYLVIGFVVVYVMAGPLLGLLK